jgi:hypothetical protein
MPMCKDTVVYKHSVFRWAWLACCSTLRNELMVHDTPLLKTFPISLPFQRFCKNSMALSYDINSRCCSLWRSYRKCYNSSSWMFLRKSMYQLHFWAHHWTLSNHHSVWASPFLIGYVEKHDAASNHQRYSNHNWMSSLCDQLYHLMIVTAHNFLPLVISQQFISQHTLWCQSDSCCLSKSMQNICNIPFSSFSSYWQYVF